MNAPGSIDAPDAGATTAPSPSPSPFPSPLGYG